MPKVYNTTRGPISFVTASGNVASVSPKSWCEISAEEVSSPSLLAHLTAGKLVLKEDAAKAVVAAPAAAPAVAAAVVAAPVPVLETRPEKPTKVPPAKPSAASVKIEPAPKAATATESKATVAAQQSDKTL